jgi:hypothetical protein
VAASCAELTLHLGPEDLESLCSQLPASHVEQDERELLPLLGIRLAGCFQLLALAGSGSPRRRLRQPWLAFGWLEYRLVDPGLGRQRPRSL